MTTADLDAAIAKRGGAAAVAERAARALEAASANRDGPPDDEPPPPAGYDLHGPPGAQHASDGGLHPLLRFAELSGRIKAPAWVVPGLIPEGVIVIAGQHGVGKTTGLVPLSMVPAGLHGPDDVLGPQPARWRHVVYVTEHVEQVEMIVGGIVTYGGLGLAWQEVCERFHVVPAKRLDVATIVAVADSYRERFARTVDGVQLMPLVVLDTKSSVIAADDENDNASASGVVAALKQQFLGCPIWIVTHVSKQNIGRGDVAGLTSRGASAIDADAHGTAFLIKDGDERYLVLGKRRCETRWTELHLASRWENTTGLNAWGEPEEVTVRWSVPQPAGESRAAVRERAQEAIRKEEATQLRGEILDAVEVAWSGGIPLNRSGVKAKVRRKAAEVGSAVDALLSECWLLEVPVPRDLRTHPLRAAFLVRLTDIERAAVLRGMPAPQAKTRIPPAWRRPESPPTSSVPDAERVPR